MNQHVFNKKIFDENLKLGFHSLEKFSNKRAFSLSNIFKLFEKARAAHVTANHLLNVCDVVAMYYYAHLTSMYTIKTFYFNFCFDSSSSRCTLKRSLREAKIYKSANNVREIMTGFRVGTNTVLIGETPKQ